MAVPFFPLLGVSPNWMLLDPMTVFTPLTCSLALFSSLCGLGIGALLAHMSELRTKRPAALRSTPPPISKAA